MNARIIHKTNVTGATLDELAVGLPAIIADVLQVPGGNLAIVRPEQVSLSFSEASPRDVGADIRIMLFARSNDPRRSSDNVLAKEILEKVVSLVSKTGGKNSVDVRIYLMEISRAES